jgi:hypothetical protein
MQAPVPGREPKQVDLPGNTLAIGIENGPHKSGLCTQEEFNRDGFVGWRITDVQA